MSYETATGFSGFREKIRGGGAKFPSPFVTAETRTDDVARNTLCTLYPRMLCTRVQDYFASPQDANFSGFR